MRKDMAKVVTERPRSGARLKQPKGYKKKSQKINEDSPQSEKIRMKWKSHNNDAKRFTDVLGPIFGYLSSKVGQPWDEVFSEICKNLPKSNTNTSHVRDHITSLVETNVQIINGKVYDSAGLEIYEGWRGNFYVHPETKLLCKLTKTPRRKYKKPKPPYKQGDNSLHQYHKIGGIWYEVFLKEVRTLECSFKHNIGKSWYSYKEEVKIPWDYVYHKNMNENQRFATYGGNYVGIKKLQVCKTKIKKLGLV